MEMENALAQSHWWIFVLAVVIGAVSQRFLMRVGMTKKMATGVMIACALVGLGITAGFTMAST